MPDKHGRNNSRYVKDNHRLRDSLPPYCTWCGEYVDVTLPRTDPRSWTTDHTVALAEGGDLYGERTLAHRACNSAKEMARHQSAPKPLRTTESW